MLLTFISTVALVHGLIVSGFAKALNRLNGSMANLVSCPIAGPGKPITVFTERDRRSFFLFFESNKDINIDKSDMFSYSVIRVVITYYASWNQNLVVLKISRILVFCLISSILVTHLFPSFAHFLS